MTSTAQGDGHPALRRISAWPWVRAFQWIALAEALSWVGLLIGMYFKYAGSPRTQIGVQVFGPIHGAIFVAFVLAALAVGSARRWSASIWIWALLASIVPLGSVAFLAWADRRGRLAPPAAGSATADSGPPAAMA